MTIAPHQWSKRHAMTAVAALSAAVLGALLARTLGAAPTEEALRTAQLCSSGVVGWAEEPNTTTSRADLAQGCRQLFKNSRCRAAVDTALIAHGASIHRGLAEECARAYCPDLPEPRPSLCAVDWSRVEESQLRDLWAMFLGQVLAHDWGEAGARVIAAEFHRVTANFEDLARRGEVPKPLRPAAPGPPPRLTVRLTADGSVLVAALLNSKHVEVGTWRLPSSRTASLSFGAVVAAAAALVPAEDRAHAPLQIKAQDQVLYRDLVALLEELRRAGFGGFFSE